jgi:hypothetical protein
MLRHPAHLLRGTTISLPKKRNVRRPAHLTLIISKVIRLIRVKANMDNRHSHNINSNSSSQRRGLEDYLTRSKAQHNSSSNSVWVVGTSKEDMGNKEDMVIKDTRNKVMANSL